MALLGNSLLVLLLVFIIGASVIMVETTFAQTEPKPIIPEFTVTVTDHSYDVETSTTTTTDPYDGHISTTTTPGYHAINGSIELSIKNQPFTPYYASNGYPIKLYYHYRTKGLDVNGHDSGTGAYLDAYFEATNTTYTTVTISYGTHFYSTADGGLVNYKADGTIDFQVEAFIGYKNVTIRPSLSPIPRAEDFLTQFVGQTSGWSNTQTAVIPNGAYTPTIPSPLPTSNPTSTPYFPTVPPKSGDGSTQITIQLSLTNSLLIAGVVFAVALAAVAGTLLYVKHRKGA